MQLLKPFDKGADKLHHRDPNLGDLLNKLLLAELQKPIDATATNSSNQFEQIIIEGDNTDAEKY